jgi:predicted dehydrogenase
VWVTRCTGELLDLPPLVLYRGKDNRRVTTSYSDVDSDWGSGFRRSSRHFIDCLCEGTVPDMEPEQATKVLQLCFAVYEAANARHPVDPRSIVRSVTPSGWAQW